MADGVKIRPSTASDAVEFHADEVTLDGITALAQRVKIVHGSPGSAVDATPNTPFPVAQADAATATKQDQAKAALDAIRAALGGTLDFTDAAAEAKLEAIRLLLAGTIAVTDATTETKLEAVRSLLAGTLTVTVTNPAETGVAKDVTLTAAKQDLDSLVATAGSTADAPTTQTLVGLLKQVVANTSNIKTDLDSIQISDSHIDLEVGGVETRLDTANAALGAPGDTAAANTIIGRLKALIAALGSPAQDATLTSAAGAAGNAAPALPTNGSGIIGWLRQLGDLLGTDGAGAPGLPGGASGVKGWLRGIYALLAGTLLVDLAAATPLAIANAATHAATKYIGVSVAESSGSTSTTKVAQIRVRDGNGGTILDTISLVGGESVSYTYPRGRAVAGGSVYVEVVTGTVEGSVFYS